MTMPSCRISTEARRLAMLPHMRLRSVPTRIVFALLTTCLLACTPTSSAPAAGLQAGAEPEVLVATTTTTQVPVAGAMIRQGVKPVVATFERQVEIVLPVARALVAA